MSGLQLYRKETGVQEILGEATWKDEIYPQAQTLQLGDCQASLTGFILRPRSLVQFPLTLIGRKGPGKCCANPSRHAESGAICCKPAVWERSLCFSPEWVYSHSHRVLSDIPGSPEESPVQILPVFSGKGLVHSLAPILATTFWREHAEFLDWGLWSLPWYFAVVVSVSMGEGSKHCPWVVHVWKCPWKMCTHGSNYKICCRGWDMDRGAKGLDFQYLQDWHVSQVPFTSRFHIFTQLIGALQMSRS